MDIIPVTGILASSAMVVFVVYFVTRSRQRRVEAQVEIQSRLIDRFGSSPELLAFLQSPAGRQFVTGVQGEAGVLARERIMSGFTRSIVLTMLGVAFVFLTFFEGERGFAIPAAILFFLGVGYLLATFVTWKIASKLPGAQSGAQAFGTSDITRS